MKKALQLFSIAITSILLFSFGHSAIAQGNVAFVNGTPQTLNVCQNASATAINSYLIASDDQAGETLTWSVFSAPTHGTLGGFNATATSIIGNSTPSGLTYTPTAAYSGGDAFVIEISNGTNSAFTLINVVVAAQPTPTFTTSPGATTCSNTNVTYTTQSGGGISNYIWNVPGTSGVNYTIISGGIGTGNSTVTLRWLTSGSKTVTVNYTNLNGCTGASPASNTTVVNLRPTPTFTSSPGANVCAGTNVTYTTQTGGGISNYIWNVPGTAGTDYTITSGGIGTGSNTVTLFWITSGSKTVTVNYTDVNGCTGLTAASNTTNVNARPVPTFTTSPGANTCSSTNVTYTTQTGGGITTYVWTVPGTAGVDYTITSGGIGTGSNTVTLMWLTAGSKTVTVNYTDVNGCTGASDASNSTTVTIRPTPTFTTSPGAISCAGVNVTYTTQTGGGITNYVWSVPGTSGVDYNIVSGGTGSGSNTVTLNWLTNGSKTVTVNYDDANGCTGLSAASNTTTVSAPTPTFTAFPSANVCAGTNVTYTTQTGGGITNYIWNVPGTSGVDYNITSGGTGTGSNTVTLNWVTAGNQTVTVNYNNSDGCAGLSPASNTTNVNARPVPAFTSAPGAGSCIGSSITYSTQSGQSSYIWTVSGTSGVDYTITSGGTGSGSNTVTLNWLTTGSKTVTVNYTDANGCTGVAAASNTTVVNSLPTPTFITSPGANTCAGASVTYTTQSGGGISNYSWGVPGTSGVDYNIISGGTGLSNSTVTLSWITGGSKTVTVNYADVNGCSGASPASNTTSVHAPTPTFTSVAPSPTCTGNDVTYTTQTGQASYSWTVSGVSGTDYNITGGGTGSGSNTVTLNWITTGTKTVTVNYTDGFGCTGLAAATTTATLNASPASTTGPTNVCTGSTITLSNTTPGGTWSSSTPAFANVGSTTGVVTGYSPGVPTIIYTAPNGCPANYLVTVNQTPTGISGTFSMCVGFSTTLTNGYGGGVWSSSNAGIASVGSSTGVVNGVSSGTASITYTLPGNCIAVQQVTVNPNPAAITGTFVVCVGGNTTLSDATSGGSFSSSSVGIGTIGSGTGMLTGISAGTTVISYILGTGCFTTATATVNPLPATIPTSVVSTFTFSGSVQNYTVPAGVSIVSIQTSGAQGGNNGGNGASIQSDNIVTPGQVLKVLVGGRGASGGLSGTVNASGYGSGGGGGSFVTTSANVPLVIAGGGGGASVWNCAGQGGLATNNGGSFGTAGEIGGTGGNGGPAGVDQGQGCGGPGHGGGGLSTNGGGPTPSGGIAFVSGGAGGGTESADNCIASFFPGFGIAVGGFGGGGAGGNGGGGGGGYSGGAGGTNGSAYPCGSSGQAPGGGGGSFNAGFNQANVASANAGNGSITISYSLTKVCVGSTIPLTNATSGGSWTSSNSSVASVGSGTGLVTGVSSGSATITYTLSTGCYTTTMITVNPLPASITGTTVVCEGLTTTLSDATGGGTWFTSNSTQASIGSTTGVVTGVTAGTPTISYILPTGCLATTVLTVNPLPAVITGTLTACPGTTTTLSNATSGGTWTSNNTSVATIGSAGVVTGVSAGTSTITYTLSTGCFMTATVTINPNPAVITGTAAVCVGLTTTLADGTSGGLWTSSNGALATVVSGTGVVTGVSAGNPTITYTLPTGCIATVLATVNPLPASIAGSNNVCVGLTTTLTDASGSSTWSSSNTSLAVIGSGSGIVTGVSAGALTITFTLPTGCIATLPFTVNPTPATITGSNNVCVGSTTTLANGTGGGTWSSSNISFATVGSSSGIVSGVAAGTLNITYTLSAGCTAIMPFTVNPTPPANTGTALVCTGFTTTLSNSTSGGTWSSSNAGLATVGSASGVVTGVSAGNPVITYTTNPGSCFATTVVTVNTTPSASTGTNNVCVGSTTTLSNSTSGGTWSSSAAGVAAVGSATGIVSGVTTGTANITYSMPTGCFTVMAMTVNSTPSAIGGAATVCTGQSTTLTDATVGGVWSSSNSGLATVGSSTGVVTGVATGNVTITYTTNPGSCFVIYAMTVNQTPLPITGSANLCIGVNTPLTNGIGGGTWVSSNTSLATIGSASGIAIGIAVGNPVITYTLPAGCFTTLLTTVNLQPASITGTPNVCEGLTTTLSNTSGGGTWTSSNTGLATVGSSSGVVSGVSAGTLTITYTLPGGCFSIQPFTVNPTPAAITGSPVVCVTYTTNLTDATTGGVWSSSNTALATVGSTTGVVTGVSAGNPSIIYTLPAGCTASVVLTVNALPTSFSMTGGGSYCSGGAGLPVGLSGSVSGTTYQLYNGTTPIGSSVSGTGSAINFGTFTTAGNYTVVATVTSTGCYLLMSGVTTISINPLPATYTVTGGGAYCTGGSGLHVYLSGSAPFGVTYQLMIGGSTPVGSPIPGTGVMLDFGLLTTAGTYSVVATITATGCTNTMVGTPTITVNPLPTAYPVTGGGGYCTGGAGVPVGLSPTDVGISYQLFLAGTPVGSPLAGTGSAISFGLKTAAGVYTIVGTSTTTGCAISMTGSVTVTVNPLPTVFAVTGGGGYCTGGTGVNIALSGSTTGVDYQVLLAGTPVGAPVSGTGSSLTFGPFLTAGTYTVVATNTATTCTSNMSGSATVIVNPLPTAFSVTGGGSYCSGGTGVGVGLSSSSIGVSYQLFDGVTPVGGPIAGTGTPLNFGLLTTATTYTVVGSNPTTGCVNNMAGSATITIDPLPVSTYSVTVTGGGGYCVGGTGVTVGLTSSSSGINYQLYNGISTVGFIVPGTGAALDFGLQTAAGTYTVRGTDPITGCTSVMTGSIVVTVNPLPTAFAVTGGGSYCAGGAGVVVGLGGSTTGVDYQLYNAGSPVGTPVAGTGSPISFGLQTLSGTYTVIATNSTTTCVNNMTGSVNITINPLPDVYTVTGGGNYCIGGTGVPVGIANSNIGINYQLYLGATLVGSAIAGTNAALNFGLMTVVGTYTVTATNPATTCTSNMTGSAVVGTNPLPAAYAVNGGGSYCAGGPGVLVGMGGSDAGDAYQLYNGGTPTGPALISGGGPLSFGLQTAAGTYTVEATTALGCSAMMTGFVNVSINPLPNAYVVTGGGGYCAGGAGVHIGLTSSETGFSYQLRLGLVPVGAPVTGTGLALDFGLQTAPGTYNVVATNPGTTCSNTMAGTVIISINPLPGLVAVTGGGSYCIGGAGMPVGISSSQIGVNYQLLRGLSPIGVPMPGTTGPIAFGLQTLAGTYTVVATDAVTGCSRTMVGSATIIINALPNAYAVTGGGNYCPGGAGVAVGLLTSDAGTDYQLFVDGVPAGPSVSGTGAALDFGIQTVTGNYTVMATNTLTGCTGSMSGSVNVGFYPLPDMHTVDGGGNYCSGGTGVPVTLNGSDIGITYQLYSAGVAIGSSLPGSGSVLDFGLQTGSGSYIVIATNAVTSCADTMNDSAIIVIDPLPADQPMTGGGSYCIGGSGLAIGLSSSELLVNYQLYNGGTPMGAPVAGTGAGISFGTFTAAGTYTVLATYTTTLCGVNMTGSVTINVNALPVSYTVTGGGNYCAGGAGVNVGLSNSQVGVDYQLYNGTIPTGPVVPGTGTAISFGLQTAGGIYTVKGTTTATGCINNMTGSKTVVVNPLPTTYSMTGGGGYCIGGTGVHIGLSGSASGISYTLYNGPSPVGSAITGTGGALDFGIFTAAGTYTVSATSASTGCVNAMTGSAVVNINALPTAYLVTGSSTSYCAGGTGVTIYLSGTQVGVSYQLYRGATAVGTSIPGSGTAIDFGPQTIAGTYTVSATNATTTCSNNMSGSAPVSINPLPTVFFVSGGGSYCPGGAGVPVILSGSNTGVKYQLYRAGVITGAPVTGTGSSINFGLQTATGSYTVIATNIATSCTSNMTGSATVALNALPVVFTVTGGGSYCAGGTGLSIGLSGSITGTNYQLHYAGSPVGGVIPGTGLPLNFGVYTISGLYTVTATSATTGCSVDMTGSASIVINPLPTVYLVTGGGNYCAGDVGVHIGLSSSDAGVSYQLYRGTVLVGTPVTGTGSSLDFGSFTALGTYTVVASNGATFCTRNMSGTAVVGMHPSPTVFTVTGGGGYCAGGAGVHVGLSGSTFGITYQLTGGATLSGTGLPLDFGLQTTTGVYTVVATNGTTGCTGNMAGSATINVNPVVVPSVTISSTYGDTVCEGNSNILTAIPVNGGSSPAYVWMVNGIPTSTLNSYTYIPVNGDVVTLTLSSSTICAIPATVTATKTMNVLPKLMPSVFISALPGVIVCKGNIVNFTAAPTNGGFAPTYQWKMNGLNVGTSPTFSYVPTDGDDIYCELSSSYVCRLMNKVSSAHVIMEVDTPITPLVTVTASPGLNVSQGTPVTFGADLDNAVPYPTYQWMINGSNVPGANMPSYTTTAISNLDIVTCEVTSGGGCPGIAGIGSVTMRVYGVGVTQVKANSGAITLVPNPNRGIFTIKGTLGTTSDDEVVIELTNMLGQVVYSNKTIARNGEINERVQLSNTLANGMYVLSLRTESEQKVFHVVIEQ